MKILSICSTEYNLEQSRGIIYWLKGDNDSNVLRLPNINNIFASYFILFIYFIFLRWFTFIKLKKNYDCVIVTGKSVVAQAIIIADQLNIPIRTVQKPFGYPWFLFEYMYIPYHDMSRCPAKNQIPTLIAPNTMEYRENNNREKRISILIGGSLHGKKYKIDKVIEAIKVYIENKNYELEIITSRRTPRYLIEEIKKLGLDLNSKYGATRNAYYNSEIVVITDDSFSMISEAIQSGIKPIVIRTGNIGKRLRKGISLLKDKKLIEFKYYNKSKNNLKKFENYFLVEYILLTQSEFINSGKSRNVYKHPYKKNMIVKIQKIHSRKNDNYIEKIFWFLYKNENLLNILPKYYGEFKTNMGNGLCYQLIKNNENDISKTLLEYLNDLNDLKILKIKIKEFINDLNQKNVPLKNIHYCNILVVENNNKINKLILIDGFGLNYFILAFCCKFIPYLTILNNRKRFKSLIKIIN